MESYSHESSKDQNTPPVLVFGIRQPDGQEVTFDMSTHGGFGDFAFTVQDGDDTKRFFVYWTFESSIFTDIMSRLRQRPEEQFVGDMVRIRDALADLTERGYMATNQGEGKMSAWMVEHALARPIELPRQYHMYSGGDDLLTIQLTDTDGVRITTERVMDEELHRDEVVLPEDELWRFAAGMIARSYSDDGRGYTQLTRFSTAQYERALAICIDNSVN